MKNFRFFLALAFAMFVINVSFGYAISEDHKDITNIVDVDVGVEAVAVATFEFTSTIFVSLEKQEAVITDNKIIFLESHDMPGIWKFENIPLNNNYAKYKANNRIINSTSGGLAG